jgi:hypothetical protein
MMIGERECEERRKGGKERRREGEKERRRE